MQRPQITEGNFTPVFGGLSGVMAKGEVVATCESRTRHEADARFLAASKQMAEALERIKAITDDGVIIRSETGKPQWHALDEIKKLVQPALLAAGYMFNE